jgi:hypothetical protein
MLVVVCRLRAHKRAILLVVLVVLVLLVLLVVVGGDAEDHDA